MKNVVKMIGLLFLVGCSDATQQGTEEGELKNEPISAEVRLAAIPAVSDTTLNFNAGDYETLVRIQMPKNGFRGTILVLQGWNFSNSDWCDSSNLCEQASKEGYCLVMPSMGKSIYHKKVYPQTRESWRKYPTRTWLVETMIATLQREYDLFLPEQSNFVMGLSTGGRGAFIIAQENPNLFAAGAALSGDYDQEAFPDDNLYRGYFGTDPRKWNPAENPVSFAEDWSVPMYLAHGGNDAVVPKEHLMRLKEVKETVRPELNFEFHIDSRNGHDYNFWGAQVPSILQFFNKNSKNER